MGAFDYFKLALSKYSQFDGRSRRSEYWYFSLFNALIGIVAGLIAGIIASIVGEWAILLAYIPSLYFLIPGIAVAIRRLHDTGKSGWFLLIGLIPLLGGLALIYFMVQDSDYESNQYGPNPKIASQDITDHLTT